MKYLVSCHMVPNQTKTSNEKRTRKFPEPHSTTSWLRVTFSFNNYCTCSNNNLNYDRFWLNSSTMSLRISWNVKECITIQPNNLLCTGINLSICLFVCLHVLRTSFAGQLSWKCSINEIWSNVYSVWSFFLLMDVYNWTHHML